MRAVADVKPQPFGQGEIAQCRVLHEQVVSTAGKQIAPQREEARHAIPHLPLHCAGLGSLGRSRHSRGFAARGRPSNLQDQEVADPFPHRAGPAPSTIARSASARAALSVRIERAHWRRAARQHASRRATVAASTLIPKIVRVNLLRRHPIAFVLIALVLLSALGPLPPLVDAVSGAPPADVDLVRPMLYTLLAPISNVLDALTFLSLERAKALLLGWTAVLALWGLLRRGTLRRRLVVAALRPVAVAVLGVAAGRLPPPVPSGRPAGPTPPLIAHHTASAPTP